MNKHINSLIAIIVFLVFFISGCSESNTTNEQTNDSSQVKTTDSPKDETFVLSFATYWSSKSPSFKKKYKVILDEIEKNSSGRIKFNVFAGGALGGASELFDACATGKADVVNAGSGHTAGRFPLTELLSLAGAFEPTKINGQIILALFDKILYKEYKGVKIISLSQTQPMYLYTSKVPINNLNDVKGLKFRTVGAMRTKSIQALGGVAVHMGLGDVYLSLQTGVIDGALTGASALPGFKLTEVLKHVVKFNCGSGANYIAVNSNTWNSLPKDLQEIMITAARKQIFLEYALFDHDEPMTSKALKEKGGTVTVLSPEEKEKWFNALKPVAQDYFEKMKKDGQPIEEALNILRTEFSNHGMQFPY